MVGLEMYEAQQWNIYLAFVRPQASSPAPPPPYTHKKRNSKILK
jgi:hypothetical protein